MISELTARKILEDLEFSITTSLDGQTYELSREALKRLREHPEVIDRLLQDGWIGKIAGFDIYVTTLLPAGTNFIAMQRRGFAFGYNWKIEPHVAPLYNSFIGDSAVQGRLAYNCGAVRATLIQLGQGEYTTV